MGTTSNFGFPFPEDTDLVRDGAQAIEDLADAVDATVAAGFRFAGQVIYDTVGTFNFDKNNPLGTGDIGLRAVRVRCQAGGAGGMGTNNPGRCVGGGGGGGYAESFILATSLAATESITVGAGGAGGTATADFSAGAAGSPSSFGTLVSAVGGLASGGNNGGGGGTATAGQIQIGGGGGGGGSGTFAEVTGAGGASVLGGGGAGLGAGGSLTGQPGRNFGGGGGGARKNATGGAGAQGIVIVDLFV